MYSSNYDKTMKLNKIKLLVLVCFFITSCADYNVQKKSTKKEKKYFMSSGFALIYDDQIYKQKIVNKKLSNDEVMVIHSSLKRNTPIKIINPTNSNFIETKISKTASYPKIFSVVITEKIATILDLDKNNPYLEIIEVKKNKKFIAKKTNTFEEERNVSEKAPVDEIKINDLTVEKKSKKKKLTSESKFIILISDFYYLDSASNLKNELIQKIQADNISIKKINNKKYRLFAGPFKNFNSLKTTYISLNNLGFENLNIYKE